VRRRAFFAYMALFAACATAGEALDALLAKDPVAEAGKAFAAGDRRHIVVPVCGRESGEVIPGWPLDDRDGAMRAIGLGKRPISCADLGDDPQKRNFRRAVRYAELYNHKVLELQGPAKR
jgi:hypothetical protein